MVSKYGQMFKFVFLTQTRWIELRYTATKSLKKTKSKPSRRLEKAEEIFAAWRFFCPILYVCLLRSTAICLPPTGDRSFCSRSSTGNRGRSSTETYRGRSSTWSRGWTFPSSPLIGDNSLAMMFFTPGARLGWIFCLHARGQVRLDILSSCQAPG